MRIERQIRTELLGEISAHLRADRPWRPATQRESRATREQDFVANLCHEMRTSMAAIRSDTEIMLLDKSLDSDERVRLKRIVTNVDLLSVALESARSMANNVGGPPERVDLAASLETVWRGLKLKAHVAGLTLVDHVPQGITYAVSRDGLLTVLGNLIRNAIDHAAPATLTVSAIEGGIELRDTGKGIDPSILSFIFDRGYTAGRSNGPAVAKTMGNQPSVQHGLGLSIARRVCELNGWRLTASSISGTRASGTGFRLCFPPFFE
ncbi:sensor histidine kinase [Achromobacter insuavis]|uniref:sensor histidine kinase n=1 Tax=Achromobacter insuavis TaxID=1287735 RepID=UPI0031B5E13B